MKGTSHILCRSIEQVHNQKVQNQKKQRTKYKKIKKTKNKYKIKKKNLDLSIGTEARMVLLRNIAIHIYI